MPGRHHELESYRYGFNGMEKDDEVSGGGNSYDFGARVYDPRLGRWSSLDPLAHIYHSLSPYQFVANSPLMFVDPDGEKIRYGDNMNLRDKIKAELRLSFASLISKEARKTIRNVRRSPKILTIEQSDFAHNGSNVNPMNTYEENLRSIRSEKGVLLADYTAKEYQVGLLVELGAKEELITNARAELEGIQKQMEKLEVELQEASDLGKNPAYNGEGSDALLTLSSSDLYEPKGKNGMFFEFLHEFKHGEQILTGQTPSGFEPNGTPTKEQEAVDFEDAVRTAWNKRRSSGKQFELRKTYD